jgi:hypothetical protein
MAVSLASSDIGMKLAQYLSVKQIISVDEDVYKIYGDEKE